MIETLDMPEVAEVTLTAEILSKHFKNKVLTSFKFISGRFFKKKPLGYNKFVKSLPLKIIDINSKGKFLWFELSVSEKSKQNNSFSKENRWYIFNTFGLTGMWSLFEPEYARSVLTFENGKMAYFSDMRNFGTFRFTDHPEDLENKLKRLAPDFLKEDFDPEKMRKYNLPIVKILMDQRKVGSGLGNYLVPEILYRAKISPHRLGSELGDDELTNLAYWIKYTVKLSYVNNYTGYMLNLEDEARKIARKKYLPDIDVGNKKFKFLVYRKKIDPLGNEVRRDKIVHGRSTYWVPAVQK
ncbi:MAG: DNA-formamidopyrimidine glycosylase family protein [Nitrososphaerota archaeon]